MTKTGKEGQDRENKDIRKQKWRGKNVLNKKCLYNNDDFELNTTEYIQKMLNGEKYPLKIIKNTDH